MEQASSQNVKGLKLPHQPQKYQQFLRLFVSTKNGHKFIICIDRSAEGHELEYQIAETYEQLVHKSPNEQQEGVKLQAYRTKHIKHRGYQLMIPKTMTVGHFLEDQSEIECQIEVNKHNSLSNEVKEEVDKKLSSPTKQVNLAVVPTNQEVQVVERQKSSTIQEMYIEYQKIDEEEEEEQEDEEEHLDKKSINDVKQTKDKEQKQDFFDMAREGFIEEQISSTKINDKGHTATQQSVQVIQSQSNHDISIIKSSVNNSQKQTPQQKQLQADLQIIDCDDMNFVVSKSIKPPVSPIKLIKQNYIDDNKVIKKNFRKSYPVFLNKEITAQPKTQPQNHKNNAKITKKKVTKIQPPLFTLSDDISFSSSDEILAQFKKTTKQIQKKNHNHHLNNSQQNLFEDINL